MSWMDSLRKSIRHWSKGPQRPTNPSTSSEPKQCYNCAHPFDEGDAFCSQCGQKNRPPKLSIGEMISESLNSLFGYDSKIWTTIKYIFIPGRLAQMYQEGKRASVLHPIRLFFFLFVILAFIAKDEIHDRFSFDSGETGIIEVELNESDSLALAQRSPNEDLEVFVLLSRDSVCSEFVPRNQIKEADDLEVVFDEWGLDYSLKNIVARQQIKFIKNRNDYSAFIVNSIIWVILLLQPILALLFKMVLRKYYFSDHLTWSLYFHSTVFMSLICLKLLSLGASAFTGHELFDDLVSLLLFINILFGFFSLYAYYKKGIFRSLLILLYISIAYVIAGSFAFIINLLVSFILF